MPTSTPEPRVAIYRADLLPISETFVRTQALALRNWHPIVVGLRYVAGGLPLTGLDTCIVKAASSNIQAWVDRARYWLDLPLPRLARAFRSLNVDLVHAHFGTDATAIWPSVKAAGLPMVVTLHGKDINTSRQWWEAGRGGMRRRVYPRRLLRMSRDPQVRFIAVSKAIARRAMAYGIPKDKITLHYIGVDTEVFKPDGLPVCQRRNRILFVGRLVDKKAPLLLIQAYAQVRSAVRDAELVIIGTGPLLDRAIRLARELAVPVDFLGARSPGEVLAHIQQARVCCLPSITAANGDAEGFGMVLLEAQACGVPVVTSARGGAAEGLLHGRTGYSVPERDIKALIVALTSILTDDQLCEAMSRESRKFVEKTFDLQQHAYELEHHYERVAELSKNSRGQE